MSLPSCSFLADSLDQNLTTNLLILGLNVVILAYNLAQLRKKSQINLSGRWHYVFLLLIPVVHALIAPFYWAFWLNGTIRILKPIASWLNVFGLRAFISVAQMACGGTFVIQESLELHAYADGYVKLGCSSFRSLWNMYVFLDWATYLLFLQPLFLVFDSFVIPTDNKISYAMLSLDICVSVFVLLATWRMMWMLKEICHLPGMKLKLLYIALIVLTTQAQWSIQACLIQVYKCDKMESLQGLAFLLAIEMIVVGGLGALSFPISDLLHVQVNLRELKGPPKKQPDQVTSAESIDFVF